MKKELKNANKKLSLGKMTVAKLQMSQQQMQRINGGEDTAKPQKPIIGSIDTQGAQCTTDPIVRTMP
jgi:hypothetical protein